MLLVIIGILLVPLSNVGIFSFIDHFKLTPDILFFVFLPALLFEASYKIQYKKLIADWRAIGMMSVVWVTISSLIIGSVLYLLLPLLWFQIPFLATLLFWVIISATDPVAVLAIFQTIGAPKRLSLLFEWESLFNDWTVVAVFIVILGIILSGGYIDVWTFAHGISSFITMIIGWIIFGWMMWFGFSKLIGYVKNDASIEILLTMVLAHLTFLLAEMTTHYFHHTLHIPSIGISWVVATVIAGIVMWNYGKYKITPKVEQHVWELWEFLAFVSNSIVFILIGLLLSDMNIIHMQTLFIPMIIAIVVVAVSRVVSVWIPIGALNILQLWPKIPTSRIHVMSWGSLRGSLALMMVLLIPGEWHKDFEKIIEFQSNIWWAYDFSIRDFILMLTIGCILFSLMIKAPTIPFLMRKTKVTSLSDYERFEYFEGMILMLMKVLHKLESMYKKGSLVKKEYKFLKRKYQYRLSETLKNFNLFLDLSTHSSKELIRRAIILHSLGAEKKFLKGLFLWNQIGEKNFRYILRKIDSQWDRIRAWENQLSQRKYMKNEYNFFQKMVLLFSKWVHTPVDIFVRKRAERIIIKKVIIELEQLSTFDIGFKKAIFKEIIGFYEELYRETEKELEEVIHDYHKMTLELDIKLSEKTLFTLEEKMVHSMHDKGIINDKLYLKFMEEIQDDFYADVRKDFQ